MVGSGSKYAELPAVELRRRLDFSDEQLLAECEVHRHRAGGPGGQHRNKVATAIRLRHRPSGLVVTATEARSQRENTLRALKRLRAAIALHVRLPLPPVIRWPPTVQVSEGRLRVNEKNPGIHHVVALVLDALAACEGRPADAAQCLGLTSSSLKRFLSTDRKVWREACRLCEAAGRQPPRR